MSSYLDIAKKVTVGNIQSRSSADHERGRGDELQPDTPTKTFVKSCKAELLEILPDRSLLLDDLGGSGSRSPSAASVARVSPVAREYSTAEPTSKADAEFDRFQRIAKPMPGGGLYCPDYGGPEMPRGVSWQSWKAFEDDCGNLGRGRKA